MANKFEKFLDGKIWGTFYFLAIVAVGVIVFVTEEYGPGSFGLMWGVLVAFRLLDLAERFLGKSE